MYDYTLPFRSKVTFTETTNLKKKLELTHFQGRFPDTLHHNSLLETPERHSVTRLCRNCYCWYSRVTASCRWCVAYTPRRRFLYFDSDTFQSHCSSLMLLVKTDWLTEWSITFLIEMLDKDLCFFCKQVLFTVASFLQSLCFLSFDGKLHAHNTERESERA